ncbi:Planctomycete cytochrome C [Anatilimnocola aggregata]|uniref:Planctomycete cytochrome C n=1 Tax=Anatilimnocola aggregata TaxID=2528021 RepID=A0A517Y6Y5_9BACT|nr:PSD1 and planctomycete cytochrome C domain-containing protein [Anatilimnocola aggregata]QDU25976.1 Planctomycete cytochrome C [Anatilimnocola aggregata]
MPARNPNRLLLLHLAALLSLACVGSRSLWADPAEAKKIARAAAENPAKVEFFEKKIRPILVSNCNSCHSAETNSRGGLRVDDLGGLLMGGASGAAIVPGNPGDSLLIQAVRYEGLEMPPKKRLTDEQIADLTTWITDGAAWPKAEFSADLTKPNAKYEELRKSHWAWQPLTSTTPPSVVSQAWPRDELDRYVLAKLEESKLAPVADAEKRDLIRRVTFDLTGLPPTLDQIAAFLADDSPQAFEKMVDGLLASPAFGERWGRHWLDVARYGESTGSARNLPYPHAWRYRDYVIDSINADKPYDQFIREQIAGDLLPSDSPEQKAEQLVATGLLALGVKDVNQRFKVRFIMDNIDEQIDTVTRSVLALTASCARCHDHKFDPIPTADYYALAGIFQSSDLCGGLRNKMGGGGLDYYDKSLLLTISSASAESAEPSAKEAEAKENLELARKEFQRLQNSPEGNEKAKDGRPKKLVARQKFNKAQQDLQAMSDPALLGHVAYGVRDSQQIADTEIRIRGEAEKLGPVVPRGFLSVVDVPNAKPVNVEQSGRLELALWLTSPENPLTSRVMANRVWQKLFGDGLVKSVDNFGVTGEAPSHPELLDHLAQRFVSDGWSVKNLVRSIVLSRTYQLSSQETTAHRNVDPANRLLWRHNPRRLTAEEIRDASLVATSTLDPQRPTSATSKNLKVTEIRNNGPEAATIGNEALASKHRSVYLPLLRGLTPTSLAVFDPAEQGMVSGARDTTTVAPQALYLLNDPFVRQQAMELTVRVQQQTTDDAERISLAYELVLGRPASDSEIARVQSYLIDFEQTAQEVFPNSKPASKVQVAAVSANDEVTDAASSSTAKKKSTAPADPDNVDQTDLTVRKDVSGPRDPKLAAWASFCQALFGSAEFRYLK